MTKIEQYEEMLLQFRGLISGERDETAVMANTAALIHQTFHFWWTGFYRVVNDELLLGPFQGPVACYRIKRGRGVCGTSWAKKETQVVPDVEQFPGHIACSSESRSEIVVPIFNKEGEVTAVLDIDSEHLATFDDTDRHYLEQLCHLIQETLY